MSVPTNLIPTKITGLPEYQGTSVDGYLPYVIDGRTYKVRFGNIAAVGAVPSTRRVATGTGLAGGGDLSEDRTIYIPNGGVGDDQLSVTGVTGGTYGSSTQIPIITVDFKGRLTSASSVALEVPVLDLSDPSKTQGALPLGRGGTGSVTSPAPGAIPYSTASSLALTSVGLAGQVLMSGGTGAPYWSTVTGTGTVTSVDASGGTTGLTFTGGPVTTVGTLTLGGTLAITHGGTGATDAATARVNIGAAASGANSDITSMSGITGAIGTPDYIDFDTAATVTRATGRLWWDNADGNQTLSLGMAGSNATLQVGQEMYFRIRASAAITEGQGVMFTGTVGASGALTGAPASGLTKDTASYFMGVATEDIPINSWGYVTQFGLVRGINTTGGAEAWVDGQILYYNPAVPGGLTKTVPAAPAAKIGVAAVVHAASNGSIFVRPISRFSLNQLNDLETSAAADLDLLQYNGPSGLWQHKSPSLISVGSATNLAGGAANRIAYQTGAGATGFVVAPTVANTYLEWSGSAFQWSANPLGTVTSVDASGGTTGLTFSGGPVTTAGTLTLGGTLAVASGGTGATSLTSGYLLKGNGTSAVSASVVYDGGTNVGIGTASPGRKLTVATSGENFQLRVGDNNTVGVYDVGRDATTGTFTIYGNQTGFTSFAFGGVDGERMRITASGDVGIGTTNPGAKLAVSGMASNTTAFSIQDAGSSVNQFVDINLATGGGAYNYFRVAFAGADIFSWGQTLSSYAGNLSLNSPNGAMLFSANGSERMRITSAGYVGVGVTPSASTEPLLQMQNGGMIATAGPYAHFMANAFYGSGGWTYTTTGTASRYEQAVGTHKWYVAASGTAGNPITFTQAMALDGAGNLSLSKLAFNIDSPFYTGGNITAGANALGIGTTGAAQVGFFTNNSERMRIDSSGNVGIGTTPACALDVYSAASGVIQVKGGSGTNQGAAYYVKYAGSSSTLAAFGDRARIFGGTPDQLVSIFTSASPLTFDVNGSERARFDTSGNLGIGTSSISYRLHVNSGAATTVGFFQSTGTSSFIGLSNASYTTYLGSFNDGSFRIQTPGSGFSDKVTVDISGNVGIGTSSPGAKLTIYDTANAQVLAQGTTSYAQFHANNTSGSFHIGIDNSTGTGFGAGAYGRFLYSTDAYPMVFFTNTTERMRIDASGNVGIGTASPTSLGANTAALSLNSTAANTSGGVVFQSGGSQSARLAVLSGWLSLQDLGSANGLAIDEQSNLPITFKTNNTERVRITSGGQLLSGTTTAVNAGGVFSTAGTNVSTTVTKNSNMTGMTLVATDNVNTMTGLWFGVGNAVHWSGIAGGRTDNASHWGTHLSFYTHANDLANLDNANERMRITGDGYVGIGTSSPQAMLHVAGGVLIQNANAINELTFSGPEYTNIYSGTTSGMDIGITSTSSAYIRFLTNNTEQVRINSAGDVGIGTSSIGAKLETYQTAGGTNAIRMNTNFASGNYVDLNPSIAGVSNGGFSISLNGTIRQVIDVSGNVGIGTTSPDIFARGYSGRIVGISSAGQSAIELNSATGSGAYFDFGVNGTRTGSIYSDVNGTDLSALGARNLSIGTSGAAVLVMNTNNVERMRIDTSGNLNIGQTGSALQSGGTGITLYGSTASEIKFLNSTTGTTATDGTALVVSGSDFVINNREAGAITLGTSNTERFRITSTGGITSSDLADAVGYKGLPQNSQTAGYTLALSDMGKHISITTGNITIPANGSVAFPVGAAVTIFNNSGSTQTISITTDTLRQAGTANTGTRTLAAYGVATVLKVDSTTWVVSGNVT